MIGFLNIYKPSGMTSACVVNKIKKLLDGEKIGHMGTLDPMACGVLPIAIGKATRMFDYFLDKKKTYRAIFEFGATTDTLDRDGTVTNHCDVIPSETAIKNEIVKFVGKVSQIPPKYSAKKIDGERAYDLARKGEKFELAPKEIEIYKFDLIRQVTTKQYEFEIECSSGTYIRSLVRDLSEKLGTLGYMTFLERIVSGKFTSDHAINLDSLLIENNIIKHIISIEKVFSDYDKYNLTKDQTIRVLNGQQCDLTDEFKKPTFLFYNNLLLGLATQKTKQLSLSVNLAKNDFLEQIEE